MGRVRRRPYRRFFTIRQDHTSLVREKRREGYLCRPWQPVHRIRDEVGGREGNGWHAGSHLR